MRYWWHRFKLGLLFDKPRYFDLKQRLAERGERYSLVVTQETIFLNCGRTFGEYFITVEFDGLGDFVRIRRA